MIKPPQSKVQPGVLTTASMTNTSAAETSAFESKEDNLNENSIENSLGWGNELPSSYELLRREGEIHEGRGTVLDDLRKNLARLEDLHGQLHFLMKEVESILRR